MNQSTPEAKRLVTFKGGRLIFAFPRDTEMNAKLSTAPGRTFIFEHGAWALPCNVATLAWIRDNTRWIKDHGFEFTTNAKNAIRRLVVQEHQQSTVPDVPSLNRPLRLRATRLGCRLAVRGA